MSSFDHVGFEILVVLKRKIWIQVREELFVIFIDPDLVQFVFRQFIPDKGHQRKASIQIDEILFLNGTHQLLSIVESDFFTVQVESIGKTLCVIHNLINGRLEPPLNVSADDVACEKEQQHRGDERERDKKDEKAGFEVSAGNFPFSFEEKLDQVSSQNK